jgi:hypothetical protein
MAHLKLVAGTQFERVQQSRSRVDDIAPARCRTTATPEAAARKAVRNLRLPGEERTISKMLAELTLNARGKSELGVRDLCNGSISRRLREFGIVVTYSRIYFRAGVVTDDVEFGAVIGWKWNWDAFPELEPYESVLEGLVL